jgi:hypothetical protein
MATRLSSGLLVNPGDLTQNTANAAVQLGAVAFDQAGNRYRYVKAGGTSLVVGKLQQAPAEVTADQGLAVAAAAIGATSVTTTSTVTVTANQYAGGWLMIGITPGVGYKYLISSHPAASGAAVTLTLSDPLIVALTTDSRVDLVANPYSGVVVNPTTATSAPVGAAVSIVTNAQFGWIQDGGVSCLLADGTVTVGTGVVASNATAGAVEALTGVQAPVGTALTGIATTDYGAINLCL